MARKIYKTINKITSFSIGLVDPKTKTKKYVYFEGGITHPRFTPSIHSETEERWQKALESSPFYGKKYVLSASFKDVVKPEKVEVVAVDAPKPVIQPESPIKKIHQVTTLQGAVVSLIKNGYEGDAELLTDVDSILAAAKSVNIEFTKL